MSDLWQQLEQKKLERGDVFSRPETSLDAKEQSPHHDEKGLLKNPWFLTIVGILIFIGVLGFAFYAPYMHRRSMIQVLQKYGEVRVESDVPISLRGYAPASLCQLFPQIITVEIQNQTIPDHFLTFLKRQEKLFALSFEKCKFESAGRITQLAEAPSLKMVRLYSCPDVPFKIIDDFKTKKPAMTVDYRGQVFLGVMIQTPDTTPTIMAVEPNSPAERMGLTAGDTIIRLNHQDVDTFQTLTKILSASEVDKPLPLTFKRAQMEYTADVILAPWPMHSMSRK